MSNLTTVDAVKRAIGIGVNGTANTVDDDLLLTFVGQASEMINAYCRRNFYVTYGTMYYDSLYPQIDGRRLFFTEDWLQVDYVWNGANGTLQSNQYRLLAPHYSPKYALEILPSSQLAWTVGNDGYNQDAIGVIGSFGYCDDNTRPQSITFAATKLASWLYMNRDNDGTVIQMGDGNLAIPSNAPSIVFTTLDRYVRLESQS
jgi:hypothetical protein